jgi:hypothetical protein
MPNPILRLDFTGRSPDGEQHEMGTIYIVPRNIKPSELPPDLKQKLIDSYPAEYLYSNRLANSCFVGTGFSGISIVNKMHPKSYSGDLFLVADAGWHVDLTLNSDGTLSGESNHWYASFGSESSYVISGTFTYVPGIAECFDRIRRGRT